MMRNLLFAAAAAVTLSHTTALAEDGPVIGEIREAWAACTTLLAATPDDWTGWRRSNEGGYADRFEFHEGEDGSAVLVQTWLIDAIATQTDTSCYRADGTLAFVFSEMVSPNVAEGAAEGAISREGRLYFAPDGRLVRLLKRIVKDGAEVAPIDNAAYQLARGCGLTTPHATLLDVRRHLDAELGDIEGNRPIWTSTPLDWCDMETE